MKTIDLSKTVYDLANQYPEFIPIMVELGFKDMANPENVNSMGRMVNVITGSQNHNIAIEKITQKFTEHGFEVVKFNK